MLIVLIEFGALLRRDAIEIGEQVWRVGLAKGRARA
jgi:hypothetical protein